MPLKEPPNIDRYRRGFLSVEDKEMSGKPPFDLFWVSNGGQSLVDYDTKI